MAAGFFASTARFNSVPQTRHLDALSARRVPQVGHIFVFEVELYSGLITQKIIPRGKLGDNVEQIQGFYFADKLNPNIY